MLAKGWIVEPGVMWRGMMPRADVSRRAQGKNDAWGRAAGGAGAAFPPRAPVTAVGCLRGQPPGA